MKTCPMLPTILVAALATLIAIPAISGLGFSAANPSGPLRVTASGGGCTNCICETLRFDPCILVCDMPMSATIENKSNSGIIVKVTLAIFLPEDIKPDCPPNVSDKQVLYYVLPHKGRVVIDFSHVFTGPLSGGEFRATAEVVWSEADGLVGKSGEASIEVSAAWPICPNGPGGDCAFPH